MTTRSSTSAVIHCRRRAWSPRSTRFSTRVLACARCSRRRRLPSSHRVSVSVTQAGWSRCGRCSAFCGAVVVFPAAAVVHRPVAGPSPVYNMAVALRLRGRLDAQALGQALADVVSRHESLRTLFVSVDGRPQQLVVPAEQADFGWDVVDAGDWSATRLDEAIDTAVCHRFDLAAEIPLRAKLFKLADDEHVVVATLHHIAADGWSITPLMRDLGVAYASRCAGRAPDWAPLPVQYVDYTLWQRAQFGDLDDSQSRIAAQLAYWEQALAGLPERLELPTDRPYPPVADHRGARLAVNWPPSCSSRWRGSPASTTPPVSWSCRPPSRCCCPSSARALTWPSGFPSQGAATRHSTSWSDSSSTPWS
ncbi:condensation domain protein [Mycobacterium xenopi 3993]|nr:condensation domain protein [Mycobacterium xenopi 3993]